MTHHDPDVKDEAGGIRERLTAWRDWIDTHPRTGWYIAVVTTLNLLMTILQVFHEPLDWVNLHGTSRRTPDSH
jgi:hypothetical protein